MSNDAVVEVERYDDGEETWTSEPHHNISCHVSNATQALSVDVLLDPANARLATMLAETLRAWAQSATPQELSEMIALRNLDRY